LRALGPLFGRNPYVSQGLQAIVARPGGRSSVLQELGAGMTKICHKLQLKLLLLSPLQIKIEA